MSANVQTATFSSALAECSSRNGSIPLIYSLMLNKDNPETFWLPIVRVRQNGCMWVNGNLLCNDAKSTGLLEGYPKGYDCVVLRTRDQFADIDKCQRHNGFICNYDSSEQCPNNAECYQTNTSKIAVYRNDISWFEARNTCREKGYDLATFEGEDLQHVAARLHQMFHTDRHFWIGLTKSAWTLQSSQDAAKYPLNEHFMYNWDDGEPTTSRDCVIMSTKNSCWKAVACSSKHSFTCETTGHFMVPGLEHEIKNTPRNTAALPLTSHTPPGKKITDERIGCLSSASSEKSDCNQERAFVHSKHTFYLLVVLNVLFIGFIIMNIIRCLCCRTQTINSKETGRLSPCMGEFLPCNRQSGQNANKHITKNQETESLTTPNGSVNTKSCSNEETTHNNFMPV